MLTTAILHALYFSFPVSLMTQICCNGKTDTTKDNQFFFCYLDTL